jgi:hypothetical protein
MTAPEDALAQARAAAAAMRERGAYADAAEAIQWEPAEASLEKLFEWALIDPDLGEVRSTRRWGAPVTALKRLLLRLLLQYHASLIAEQTRFNVGLLVHLRRLEERIDALEAESRGPTA